MEKKPNTQQINIELDEKISGGEYSNFVVVTHSSTWCTQSKNSFQDCDGASPCKSIS